jgi:hypothetical protein
MLANKWLKDEPYDNTSVFNLKNRYARLWSSEGGGMLVGGRIFEAFTLLQLNAFEINLLSRLSFNLNITPEDLSTFSEAIRSGAEVDDQWEDVTTLSERTASLDSLEEGGDSDAMTEAPEELLVDENPPALKAISFLGYFLQVKSCHPDAGPRPVVFDGRCASR